MCLGRFTENKNKGIYKVGIKGRGKYCGFRINGKKQQGGGGSQRKASSTLCEKKGGRIWPRTDHKF